MKVATYGIYTTIQWTVTCFQCEANVILRNKNGKPGQSIDRQESTKVGAGY